VAILILTQRYPGYVGGTVLWKLLQHPRAIDFQITALVRDAAKAEKLKAFGIVPVVGDNSNLDLLQALARDAEVVFSVASVISLLRVNLQLSVARILRRIVTMYSQ
jgi:uncharacterized protein YbjT (DUF2867 family)